MNYTEYLARYPEGSEIGRDITPEELCVFNDNGSSVGCWRVDRRSTVGRGEVLSEEDAACARDYYSEVSKLARQEQEQHGRGR